jgi:hypothetical protein
MTSTSTMLRRSLRALGLAVALVAGAASLRAQDTQFRGFTDVTYWTGRKLADTSAFALGQFDLYITSRLADKVSFLGETVFEFDHETSDFVVDVERLIVTVTPNAHFRFAAGKHHTPIGFWNNAYHHGAAMQPTIARPALFRFEDDGGILPIHSVGVLAAGRDLTPAHLGFDVLVGNNIGGTPEGDTRSGKAITVAAHGQITSELRVGASLYGDQLRAGTPSLRGDTLGTSMTERIAGGFVTYQGSSLEVIGEYQGIRNTPAVSSPGATAGQATGVVAYGGYRLGKFVPYAVYDETRAPQNDVYLPSMKALTGTVGLRYEYAPMAVFKLELSRQAQRGRTTASIVAMQAAVGF